MHELVEGLFLEYLKNPLLELLEDQAVFEVGIGDQPSTPAPIKLAFTTDSYVVDPIFFPGGDIGKLAINGTVNDIAMSGARPLILSGTIGDHGTTIMIARGELELETEIESDTAPLGALVHEMLDEAARVAAPDAVHCLRDPTRGGVATTLNEIALSSEVYIEIREDLIPVREEVKGACEILGLDPLYVANEGKLIALVSPDAAESIIARMKQNPYGLNACIIGEVKAEPQGIVAMRTGFGGTRIVDMLVGEQLPRIC
ncbi:MAG: hydrogenase expression/formation protein HypE [Acidobacteria bacterium]|nr:hydrogenase expression/formation protein HypE [Acidobacteriota bacterium]